MIVTQHGNPKEPFFKGVAKHLGRKLVWFGYSKAHVFRKEEQWIRENMEALNAERIARTKQRPALRLVTTNV